jgi:hypothetical protein
MTHRFTTSVFLGLSLAALAAAACSSSSSGGGGSSGAAACFSQGNTACASCVESKCGGQLSAVESGCSDFIGCVCPGGSFNSSLASQCLSKEQEASCMSAVSPLQSCETSNCASACTGSSSGGSGGGSGSGSGGTTADGVSCLIPMDQFSGGPICYLLQTDATQTTAQLMTQCTTAGTSGGLGGSVVSACPTANLVGCCQSVKVVPSVSCFYASTQSVLQSQCSGPWMTSP